MIIDFNKFTELPADLDTYFSELNDGEKITAYYCLVTQFPKQFMEIYKAFKGED